MSAGSKQVAVRFPEMLLDQVQAELLKSQHTRRGEPWTMGEFVRVAVEEKLAKMRRGRAPRRREPRDGTIFT